MKKLLDEVVSISIAAGQEILDVYENEFDVEIKGDGSPLTIADRRAHQLICRELEALDSSIPVLSEESDEQVMQERFQWNKYWLVDPLDGTREFVKRNGEFTVNIALIDEKKPILGVVHTPVKGITHFAAKGCGAFKSESDGVTNPISTRKFNSEKAVMVASRSHTGEAVLAYQARLAEQADTVETTNMGSSLKICLVAEGAADIYPRLGLTSEWDTAAAHCVLEVAGGAMTNVEGDPLQYNKHDILNPWFLACGDDGFDWAQLAQGLQSDFGT